MSPGLEGRVVSPESFSGPLTRETARLLNELHQPLSPDPKEVVKNYVDLLHSAQVGVEGVYYKAGDGIQLLAVLHDIRDNQDNFARASSCDIKLQGMFPTLDFHTNYSDVTDFTGATRDRHLEEGYQSYKEG